MAFVVYLLREGLSIKPRALGILFPSLDIGITGRQLGLPSIYMDFGNPNFDLAW